MVDVVAAAAPVAEPPADDDGRDWSELPLDALSLIFIKVGAVDVLMGAGLVCRSWLDAAKVPDVWRTVDMEDHRVIDLKRNSVLRAMAKAAVDRSDGQLVAFAAEEFVDVELLQYILQRSPSLRSIRLLYCDDMIGDQFSSTMINNSSSLGELRSLQLDCIDITVEQASAVIDHCPQLELLCVLDCFFDYQEDDANALLARCARTGLAFDWDLKSYDDYLTDYDYCWPYDLFSDIYVHRRTDDHFSDSYCWTEDYFSDLYLS